MTNSRPTKTVAMAVVVALVLLATSGCEKDLIDEEVKRLCENDGGVKIHEHIYLPAEKFDRFGEIRVNEKSVASPVDPYFYVLEVKELRTGKHLSGAVTSRSIVGKTTSFSVRASPTTGGPWNESSYSCPEGTSPKHLAQRIFRRERRGDLNSRSVHEGGACTSCICKLESRRPG